MYNSVGCCGGNRIRVHVNQKEHKVSTGKINPIFIITVGEVKGSRQEFSLTSEILKKFENIIGFIKPGR